VAQSLGDELRIDGLPWSPVIGPPAVSRMSLSQDLFHAVFAVAVVIALVILVLAYVVRHALLSVLIVVAPLAALCTALPDTRGYARGWMRLLSVTVLMQPVQLIILRVAEVVAVDPEGGLVQSLYALATLFLMLKVPGALNVAAHLETKAETLGHRLQRSVVRAVRHGHTTRRRT
jgi:Conjugal transfer protein TrbL